jgi:hypothetical protein
MPSLHFLRSPRLDGRAPIRPWISRAVLGALLVAGAVGLAACGGSGGSAGTTATGTIPSSTPTSTTGAPGGANSAVFAKYTACLKQHGVTLPTRRGGGGGFGGAPPTGTNGTSTTPRQRPGGFNTTKFRAAQTACSKLLPAGVSGFGRGGQGGGFGGGGATNSAAFAAYRNCLTLHGVKLAAGAFGRPTAGGKAPSAKTTKALAACASLRPKFNRRPPTSTAPPTTTTS